MIKYEPNKLSFHEDTPKVEREAIWANATTGEDFRCVHIDDAKIMETLLRKAVAQLREYGNHGLGFSDSVSFLEQEISAYLDS